MLLMHKDIPVADINVRDGTTIGVNKIFNRDHYPAGAFIEHKNLQSRFLDHWLKSRSIPSNRQNINSIMNKLGCSVSEAAVKNMAVSLTDCYWLKNDDDLTWNDVDYRTNSFFQNLSGDGLTDADAKLGANAPDLVTDGVLEKYWMLLDGEIALVKFGKFGDMAMCRNLLSANEVVASQIADIMGVDHVHYFPVKLTNDEVVSGCHCFIKDSNEEFVTALQLQKSNNLITDMDLLHHMWDIGLRSYTDELITLAAIIGNTDCHTKNFGIIRDTTTLELISSAPLYDNGSCLGWDGEYNLSKASVKPFKYNIDEQLELVENFPNDIPSPKDAQEIIEKVYKLFDISDECCENAKVAIEDNINRVISRKRKGCVCFDNDILTDNAVKF